MITRLLNHFKRKNKIKRLERYRLQLALIGGRIYNTRHAPKLLSDFWCGLNVDDLTRFNTRQRLSIELDLAHRNLVELVEFIEQFNTLMAEEKDSPLEQLCLNKFNDTKPQVLDHYLSDDKHLAIDVKAYLTRLRGQLLSHVTLLEPFDNQYYQRQANRMYLDIYRLTVQLVEILTEKEISLIKNPT